MVRVERPTRERYDATAACIGWTVALKCSGIV
jgi:hypothetical protein